MGWGWGVCVMMKLSQGWGSGQERNSEEGPRADVESHEGSCLEKECSWRGNGRQVPRRSTLGTLRGEKGPEWLGLRERAGAEGTGAWVGMGSQRAVHRRPVYSWNMFNISLKMQIKNNFLSWIISVMTSISHFILLQPSFGHPLKCNLEWCGYKSLKES